MTIQDRATQRWSELSERQRTAIIVGGTVDAALRVAALVDLARRPQRSIRGPRWLWAVALAVVNSAGVLPVAYFARGRRHT